MKGCAAPLKVICSWYLPALTPVKGRITTLRAAPAVPVVEPTNDPVSVSSVAVKLLGVGVPESARSFMFRFPELSLPPPS